MESLTIDAQPTDRRARASRRAHRSGCDFRGENAWSNLGFRGSRHAASPPARRNAQRHLDQRSEGHQPTQLASTDHNSGEISGTWHAPRGHRALYLRRHRNQSPGPPGPRRKRASGTSRVRFMRHARLRAWQGVPLNPGRATDSAEVPTEHRSGRESDPSVSSQGDQIPLRSANRKSTVQLIRFARSLWV